MMKWMNGKYNWLRLMLDKNIYLWYNSDIRPLGLVFATKKKHLHKNCIEKSSIIPQNSIYVSLYMVEASISIEYILV